MGDCLGMVWLAPEEKVVALGLFYDEDVPWNENGQSIKFVLIFIHNDNTMIPVDNFS